MEQKSLGISLRTYQENDKAVMEAYGFTVHSPFTDSFCVAELFRLYGKLTG